MELLEKEREERNLRMQKKLGKRSISWGLRRSSVSWEWRVAGDAEPVIRVIVAVILGGGGLSWIGGPALDSEESILSDLIYFYLNHSFSIERLRLDDLT
ncbi:hypothetical protein TorRG33x02_018480 [Trema orientale]|uniref:Uncharacterized protein n=1 Tax=Trema orientale TaxID=63057 RepID=A0A2P5FWA4_TREOI|nr:hypothetical protein TorRG33x02_018480 [Trema orientale]